MRFFNFLILLTLVSCSSWNKNQVYESPTSVVNRKISSENFYNMNMTERLNEVKRHIRKTADEMPSLGNPRYHLFEHFSFRANTLINEIQNSGSKQLSEKAFVPTDLELAKKIMAMIQAHKAMSKAGIYINYSAIVEEDSDQTKDNLFSLSRVMKIYEDEIKNIFGIASFPPELVEELQLKERISLLKHLSNRISFHIDEFISSGNKRKRINQVLSRIDQMKFSTIIGTKRKVKYLRRSKNFKRTKQYLANLPIPDSGSINGIEDSFERVMSVQLGMELIDFITDNF